MPSDGRKYELVGGRLRVVPTGARHGEIVSGVIARGENAHYRGLQRIGGVSHAQRECTQSRRFRDASRTATRRNIARRLCGGRT